jgi:hypothetical protein
MTTQRPGYIPSNRRLLRNDKPHTTKYTDTATNTYNNSAPITATDTLTNPPAESEAKPKRADKRPTGAC